MAARTLPPMVFLLLATSIIVSENTVTAELPDLLRSVGGLAIHVGTMVGSLREETTQLLEAVGASSRRSQLMPVRYSYADIMNITKGFSEKIGQGGYSCVYKGKLYSGQLVAVKMLRKVDKDDKDFINEVAIIRKVHHYNVVHLIGFCAEGSNRALVYPFMPNGSLDKYILSKGRDNMNHKHVISDEKMYEIVLGIAHGIEYLHQGCDMQILHFDIKPHNILLDENFVPKVADFGIAKLSPTNKTVIKCTIGYMAPEISYRSIRGISDKVDVYSFGRMLIEMATRNMNGSSLAENSSQIFLPSWLDDAFEEEKEIRKKMIVVGLWCVQLSPVDRPSMRKVIEMLQGGLDALQLPPKPSFAPIFLPTNMARLVNRNYQHKWGYNFIFKTSELDEFLGIYSHDYVA